MFTGIISTTAKLVSMQYSLQGCTIRLPRQKGWKLRSGDSLAVNGICSTIVRPTAALWTLEYMPETLRKTTVRDWNEGQSVHLERPLALQDLISGHLVTGHIDTTATVTRRVRKIGESVLWFTLSSDMRYVFPKGSITIDGVALTIVDVRGKQFSVHLIPETRTRTHLAELDIGSKINVEFDAIAKMVERFVRTNSSRA